MEKEITGLIPPIPTAFGTDEELLCDQYCANIEKWNKQGYSGYVVLGSNGEFVHLSEAERLKVVESARQVIPRDKLMIVGAGQNSTRETIAFILRVASMRADAVMVGTPHYYREMVKLEHLMSHYQKIADSSPIPVILYNVPQFTGISLTAEVVARLAEHPNIVGIKDSSGILALLAEILRLTPSRFSVLIGSAPLFFPALALGAKGAILAVSSVAPEACLELMASVASNHYSRAAELQLKLLPVARAVTTQFGIGGLKAALDLIGFYGGPPRSPLPPADEKVRAEIKAIFRASGLFERLN
ncbi:MAG: dihydrodipicolinate synthase family protein [candidate division WOR-3 bacterium]